MELWRAGATGESDRSRTRASQFAESNNVVWFGWGIVTTLMSLWRSELVLIQIYRSPFTANPADCDRQLFWKSKSGGIFFRASQNIVPMNWRHSLYSTSNIHIVDTAFEFTKERYAPPSTHFLAHASPSPKRSYTQTSISTHLQHEGDIYRSTFLIVHFNFSGIVLNLAPPVDSFPELKECGWPSEQAEVDHRNPTVQIYQSWRCVTEGQILER
jgi:hypothetical protein